MSNETNAARFSELMDNRKLLRYSIMLTLPDAEAWALAQLCKRICWSDMRALASDDGEAQQMRSAIYLLQRALADNGCAPR